MTEQFRIAMYRALGSSALTAAMTFLTTWQATDDAKTLTIATATAFLTPLAIRWGGEGYLDTVRAAQRGEPANPPKDISVTIQPPGAADDGEAPRTGAA